MNINFYSFMPETGNTQDVHGIVSFTSWVIEHGKYGAFKRKDIEDS